MLKDLLLSISSMTTIPARYVYICTCADDTLYTGITTNLAERIHAHNHLPTGAKYTKSRRPISLVWHSTFPDKSTATKEECRIKKLSKQQKLQLIAQYPSDESIGVDHTS